MRPVPHSCSIVFATRSATPFGRAPSELPSVDHVAGQHEAPARVSERVGAVAGETGAAVHVWSFYTFFGDL
jgi:hypothetical protein